MKKIYNIKAPLLRFNKKFKILENGCWIWIAGAVTDDHGFSYGQFWLYGRNEQAHRASWTLHKGSIPRGLMVCHKCDVPLCVNPDHLFLGTSRDNMLDMVSKGRNSDQKGEAHSQAILTENLIHKAKKMRGKGMTYQAIADALGVIRGTLQSALGGKTWNHLK